MPSPIPYSSPNSLYNFGNMVERDLMPVGNNDIFLAPPPYDSNTHDTVKIDKRDKWDIINVIYFCGCCSCFFITAIVFFSFTALTVEFKNLYGFVKKQYQ